MEAPDILFEERQPPARIPLDELAGEGDCARAVARLKEFRRHAEANPAEPWSPIKLVEDDPDTTAAFDLWLAGLVRMLVAHDVKTGGACVFVKPA